MKRIGHPVRVAGLSVAIACAASHVSAADARPTVAVAAFAATPAGWMPPPPQLGTAAAQLVVDRMVASGQYHVIDRWVSPTRSRPSTMRSSTKPLSAASRRWRARSWMRRRGSRARAATDCRSGPRRPAIGSCRIGEILQS